MGCYQQERELHGALLPYHESVYCRMKVWIYRRKVDPSHLQVTLTHVKLLVTFLCIHFSTSKKLSLMKWVDICFQKKQEIYAWGNISRKRWEENGQRKNLDADNNGAWEAYLKQQFPFFSDSLKNSRKLFRVIFLCCWEKWRTISFEKGPFLDGCVRSEASLLFLPHVDNKDAQIIKKNS